MWMASEQDYLWHPFGVREGWGDRKPGVAGATTGLTSQDPFGVIPGTDIRSLSRFPALRAQDPFGVSREMGDRRPGVARATTRLTS